MKEKLCIIHQTFLFHIMGYIQTYKKGYSYQLVHSISNATHIYDKMTEKLLCKLNTVQITILYFDNDLHHKWMVKMYADTTSSKVWAIPTAQHRVFIKHQNQTIFT